MRTTTTTQRRRRRRQHADANDNETGDDLGDLGEGPPRFRPAGEEAVQIAQQPHERAHEERGDVSGVGGRRGAHEAGEYRSAAEGLD